MRGLIAALLVVAGLAVGADVLVTRAAERRVAVEVEQSMGGDAQVDLRGWPVSLGLLRGEVDQALITATQVPLREAPGVLPSVDVVLSGVSLDYGRGAGTVDADSGRFTARVDQAALTSLATAAGVGDVAQVQLAGDRLQAVVNGVAIDLLVTARDGALVVRPENDILDALSGGERIVPVAGLPPGTALESAEVRDGLLLLGGPVDLATLAAGRPS